MLPTRNIWQSQKHVLRTPRLCQICSRVKAQSAMTVSLLVSNTYVLLPWFICHNSQPRTHAPSTPGSTTCFRLLEGGSVGICSRESAVFANLHHHIYRTIVQNYSIRESWHLKRRTATYGQYQHIKERAASLAPKQSYAKVQDEKSGFGMLICTQVG